MDLPDLAPQHSLCVHSGRLHRKRQFRLANWMRQLFPGHMDITFVPEPTFLSPPSESWAGSAPSRIHSLCSCSRRRAQTSPLLALWFCCHQLATPNNCWTRGLIFSFAVGPTNNVPVPGANVSKHSVLLFSEEAFRCVWERPDNPVGQLPLRKGRYTLEPRQGHLLKCRKEISKFLFIYFYFIIVHLYFWSCALLSFFPSIS